MTYEFFDLRKAITSNVVQKTNAEQATTSVSAAQKSQASEPEADVNLDAESLSRALMGDKSKREMRGILNNYRPSRGYGMATGHDGNSYFVHVYSVVDLELRERLSRYSGETPVNLEIPITFVDAGKTKEHVRYNEAKQVHAIR